MKYYHHLRHMPRRYRSRKRDEGVQLTRRRIIEATMQLHAEQGIVATNWEDIARRAGVSLATVYRHFPSLDELVPACGALAEDFIRPPLPELAEATFDGLDELDERLRRLVDELCTYYERGGDALLLARREGHLVEALAAWARKLDRTVETFVRAAVRPANLDERTVKVIAALASFPVWQSLVDTGLPPSEVQGVIRDLLSNCVGRSAP